MKLRPADLILLVDEARRSYIQMPAEARLPGQAKPMDERDRHALCFLRGSILVLKSLGLLNTDVNLEPELDFADSEPATEF